MLILQLLCSTDLLDPKGTSLLDPTEPQNWRLDIGRLYKTTYTVQQIPKLLPSL